MKLDHYYNEITDEYIIIANDAVVIRQQYLPNASHKLPFTMRKYGYTLNSPYGYGLCEAVTTFKSQINKLDEMLMEGIERSSQESIFL